MLALLLLPLTCLAEYLAPTVPCPQTKLNVDKMFRWVHIDKKLCQYFDYNSNFLNENNGFLCELDNCLAYCLNDPECNYAIYDEKTEFCVKSDTGHVTDDPIVSPRFRYDIVYVLRHVHGGPAEVPYKAGFCGDKTIGECALYGQCGWDYGEKGYNDYHENGTAPGFCGRKRCTPGCSDLMCTHT